jgi:tetratricopeptide (TPR) repeat protein
MISRSRPPSPQRTPDWLLGLAIALAVLGITSIARYFLGYQRYESALQSYRAADCRAAVEKFNQIIDDFRSVDPGQYAKSAETKKAECGFFENAVSLQKDGKYEAALLGYAKLAVYEDSNLLAPTRTQISNLFQKLDIKSVSTLNVCDRLGVLTSRSLLPKSNANLQSLYLSCGGLYSKDKNYEKAVGLYENFLKEYPSHLWLKDVQRSLAQASISDIKSRKGVRKIMSPRRTGTTADGSTVINIQNISPATMRITISGATPKFEKLKSCSDCVVYDGNAPDECFDKGPIGQYTVEPGEYDIAIETQLDDGGQTKPWAGNNWVLEPGGEYGSCFIIVKDPLEKEEKEKKKEQKEKKKEQKEEQEEIKDMV